LELVLVFSKSPPDPGFEWPTEAEKDNLPPAA
jgi:hypothetical protein